MQIQHVLALGKRERFTHQTTQPLAQGVIQAFDVSGVPSLFADHLMRGRWQTGVSAPKIAVADAALIGRRQLAPQALTRLRTAVPDEKREDLPRPATLHNPDAPLLFFHSNKGEEFIHLQLIAGLPFNERGLQRRERLGFF